MGNEEKVYSERELKDHVACEVEKVSQRKQLLVSALENENQKLSARNKDLEQNVNDLSSAMSKLADVLAKRI